MKLCAALSALLPGAVALGAEKGTDLSQERPPNIVILAVESPGTVAGLLKHRGVRLPTP